ncbi:acetyltransferase [Sphingopyxis lindanitolerans]|uniref:Acetyltransferase n=1 Tax=Sphingopyxis lindanitolerans TaxID=2054227 RepID=A0A2S8B563_9SPHN|nr:NeuD/PglB/VioB family sugar acetyltransferase [Sphingopyxis lindanitolerans]PQM27456.1 acetyltransferase [Sphingopyxis lindanitolerans]
MRYVIYGAGGCGRDIHASLVRLLAAQGVACEILFCDKKLAGQSVQGVPIMAPQDIRDSDRVLIAINDGRTRQRLANGIMTASFIAATSLVSDQAMIGDGALISDFVILGPSARIGKLFHANHYSSVAHDCIIGDFVTFGPGVRCNGNVTIGSYAYIGANASIRQGISIGENAIVGMGAVVVRDVPANAVVVGNPARTMVRPTLLKQAS